MSGVFPPIFISYARGDGAFVDGLQARLEQHHLTCWIDRRNLAGGQQFDEEIRVAIRKANMVLLMVSPAALASPWVRREWTYALKHSISVIPILCSPTPQLPRKLRKLQYVDFTDCTLDTDTGAEHFAHLLHAIELVYQRIGKSTELYIDLGSEPVLLPSRIDSFLAIVRERLPLDAGNGRVEIYAFLDSAVAAHYPHARFLGPFSRRHGLDRQAKPYNIHFIAPSTPDGRRLIKDSSDAELTILAQDHAAKARGPIHFVLVSADRDFLPLIQHLLAGGHRVSVWATILAPSYKETLVKLGCDAFEYNLKPPNGSQY